MSKLAEFMSGISGAKVVAYLSLGLDKVVLLVLFLLKRMDAGPDQTGFQVLTSGGVHWTTLVRMLIDPQLTNRDREFITLTGLAASTVIDLLVTIVLVVCLRRRLWPGILPWLLVRAGFIFLLLAGAVWITPHALINRRRNGVGMNATEQTEVDGSANQTPLLTFDGVNFCLLWALVLSVSWVVVFKEFSDVVRNADSRDISSCGVVVGQHIEKSHHDDESFVEETNSFVEGDMSSGHDTTLTTIPEEDEILSKDDIFIQHGAWNAAALRLKRQSNDHDVNERNLRTFSSFN